MISDSVAGKNPQAVTPGLRPITAFRGQPVALATPVGRIEIQQRSVGNNSVGIHVSMRLKIVTLDVLHIHCLGNPGHLVNIPRVPPHIRIIDNPPYVALEVGYVHGIERTSVTNKRISASVNVSPHR